MQKHTRSFSDTTCRITSAPFGDLSDSCSANADPFVTYAQPASITTYCPTPWSNTTMLVEPLPSSSYLCVGYGHSPYDFTSRHTCTGLSSICNVSESSSVCLEWMKKHSFLYGHPPVSLRCSVHRWNLNAFIVEFFFGSDMYFFSPFVGSIRCVGMRSIFVLVSFITDTTDGVAADDAEQTLFADSSCCCWELVRDPSLPPCW